MATNSRPLSRARGWLRGGGALIGSVLAIAAVLGLSACGEPLHSSKWKNPPGEIPEGEGLLTGEDGEWEIYRDN